MFFTVAGPCVIESRDMALRHAEALTRLLEPYPIIFKASYDKANRTNVHSFRGVGIERGLAILAEIRREFRCMVLTDVHTIDEAAMAGEVVDIIQIPAFLCRQTDLLMAAGLTGKTVNIKKGPFIDPATLPYMIEKVRVTGNTHIWVTERGVSHGYQDLIVDYRTFLHLKEMKIPSVYDATHSQQTSGGITGYTKGGIHDVEPLAQAAIAIGVSGLFFEVHEDPSQAKSDAATQIPLAEFGPMIERLYAFAKRIAE